MKLTSVCIPGVTELKMVTATSTFGIGFVTSIMLMISHLLGSECEAYNAQVEKAKNAAASKIVAKAKAVGASGIMNVNFQVHGTSVFVSGVAYQ